MLGSHREHHERWGKGRLGSEGLKALLDRELDAASLEWVRRLATV